MNAMIVHMNSISYYTKWIEYLKKHNARNTNQTYIEGASETTE